MAGRPDEDAEALRQAYEARGRLLASQRWAFGDRADDLEAEIRALREKVRWLEGLLEERTGELERLRATRSFRVSRAIGRAGARIRRLLGRRPTLR